MSTQVSRALLPVRIVMARPLVTQCVAIFVIMLNVRILSVRTLFDIVRKGART
jgi:hypothetical protein